MVQLSHLCMPTGKNITLALQIFVSKVMSLLFNTLSRCHCFFSKEQASFNFMAAVTVNSGFGAQENKICHCFHFFPIYLPWSVGTRCQDLRGFFNVEFKPAFSLSFSPLSRGSLVPLHFLLLEWYLFAYLKLLIFLLAILIPGCDLKINLITFLYFHKDWMT